MKQWIEDVLALQETDLRVRRLLQRKQMLPVEKKKLEKELNEALAQLKTSKEMSSKTEMEIKQVESDIKQENDTIQKLQGQSTMIKKNDEYKAMLSEISRHKANISKLETKEIGLLDEIEGIKKQMADAEKVFKLKEREIKEQLEELEELEEELEEEVERMQPKRDEQAGKVDGEVMSLYNRLFKRGKGQPMVPVHNGNCGNCHLKLTPQTINETRKEGLVFCENCTHLLYMPEAGAQ